MKYLVFDLETTSHETYGRFANPFDDRNQVVVTIEKRYDKELSVVMTRKALDLDGIEILVGHNIKFDLGYYWEELKDFFRAGGTIWDTMLAEYILSGQLLTMMSLDKTCAKYGIPVKPHEVKDILKENQDGRGFLNVLEKAPQLAEEYCRGDGMNTEAVFKTQLLALARQEQQPIMKVLQNYQLATLEAEYNGMHLDFDRFMKLVETYSKRLAKVETALNTWGAKYFPKEIPFNPGSTKHLSAVLFGTPIPTEVIEMQGYYKNGNPHMRKVKKEFYLNIFNLVPLKENKTKKNEYKVGELEFETFEFTTEEGRLFKKHILEYRDVKKFFSTYLEGFKKYISPDHCIRGQFLHCLTHTGRLSSRNPNIQNLDPRILPCINSRYPGGRLAEIDFSQIEVVVAAYLSKDAVLKQEIESKVDMHRENAAYLHRKCVANVTPEERKKTKSLTFGLLYGAGVRELAKANKIDEGLAKRFKDGFYDKYQGIREWHETLVKTVENYEEINPLDHVTRSVYRTSYGKRYTFIKEEAPEWLQQRGYELSFRPTQIKNYMAQGMAADLMAVASYECFRYCLKYDLKLINIIHDSLVFDFRSEKECVSHMIHLCAILERSGSTLAKQCGVEWDVPITAEYKYGKTWEECK